MFRFLPGIVLVQVVTLALFWVNLEAELPLLLLRAGVPALIIGCVTALWLSTLGRIEAEQRNATLCEQHASEREQLHREIERARSDVLQQASADKAQLLERAHVERARLVEETHQRLLKGERSISRRANLKVGLAFMAVTSLGVLMLLTELMTLGILTISTAGGAMGGYLLRWRQTRRAMDRWSGKEKPVSSVSVPRLVQLAPESDDASPRRRPLARDAASTGTATASDAKSAAAAT